MNALFGNYPIGYIFNLNVIKDCFIKDVLLGWILFITLFDIHKLAVLARQYL